MAWHKFKIGQRVTYRPSRYAVPASHTVTALLPAQSGEFKDRIRRSDDAHDFVVGESELREIKAK